MANVTQQDINQIVKIQMRITPQQHFLNEVDLAQVQLWLTELAYVRRLRGEALIPYIVMDAGHPIGIDTLALLQCQYDVADVSHLIFKQLKLGGALLKDARGIIFDHCDFTYCAQLNTRLSAFIKTHQDLMNNFTQARFLNCDLHEVLFKNVMLNQAYISKTKVSATQFLYCDLAECEFEDITFSRMPRFVHSNLYHSHAHLHSREHRSSSLRYGKTALLGGVLISVSIVILALMMFDVIAPAKAVTLLTVGLLTAGVVLGYLGAASSFRQQNMAHDYQLFESTVDNNACWNRSVTASPTHPTK